MHLRERAHFGAPTRAFTLVELIGVLAIMAILAATIAPNAIRMMDRAVVDAEVRSLKAVATCLEEHARENDAFPAPPANPLPSSAASTWQNLLVRYADVSSADLLWNKRGLERRYLVDTTNPRRALLVSSLNDSLPLPAFIDFDSVWDTRDGQVPVTFGGTWGTTADAGRYLVIQRINLTVTQRTYAIYLVNRSNLSGDAFAPGGEGGTGGTGGTGSIPPPTPADPAPASYRVIRDRQTPPAATIVLLPGTDTDPLLQLRANDQLELYDNAGVIQMVYVVSTTGRSFVFTNLHEWRPQ